MNPIVVAIYSGAVPRTPLHADNEATLQAGRGLVGDRYYARVGTFSEKLKGRQDWEVTLIELEEIERFNALEGIEREPGEFRRNIVTRDVRLNALVGQRFVVGEALLEGIRLCEPCAHLAALVSANVVNVLAHRAGLRARVVVGATIRKGDVVRVQNAV